MSETERPNYLAAINALLLEGRARPQPDLATQRAKLDLRDRSGDFWLRIGYAVAWFVVVAAQLVFMNWLMFRVGKKELVYDGWLFNAYLVGTFVECIGIVLVITRNLFPNRDRSPKPH